MAILVTGGAGFIGSHLIQRLLARPTTEPVVCLDNFSDYYDPGLKRANAASFAGDRRVVLVEGSLGDSPLVGRLLDEHQVSRVVHLGAIAGVRNSIAHPLAYEEINVRGTLVLLEAVRARPIERFLLVSSSTVYGSGAEVPFREDAPLGVPLSPYGASKRAAELLGLVYHRLHGVPVVCLRPFSVYGPRMRPDLAMYVFAKAILQGRPLPLFGDGTVRRDFTYVADICAGLESALDARGIAGETINLGHHEPLPMRELIVHMERVLGRAARIEQRPPVAGDMPVTCADLSKAERLLGYRPRVALDDGLREFARWFRSAVAE